MNPRKAKASTREDKENEKDAKRRSVEKKKQKIPAGLALMHGISSTSVGKSRLTVRKSCSRVGMSPYPLISRRWSHRQISAYLIRVEPPQK
jgi:hypothetical protein